ncbi:MAG: cell division protein FtsL [Candidatus Kapaibacterium sp.]
MADFTFPDEAQEPKESPALVKERKLLNRWSIFGLLIISSVLVVLYVSNVVRVNTLLREMQDREKSRDSLLYVNLSLQNEIMRLQSAERITAIAQSKLNMIQNPQAPKRLP